MARFHYRLQPALDAALAREREALGAYVRARGAASLERRLLDDLSRRERDQREHVGVRLALPVPAAAFAAFDRGARSWAVARLRRLPSFGRLEAAATAATLTLEKASQRRAAFERHRAKARTAWLARELLAEAAEFDESNTLAQARAQRPWKNFA